jgi:hypothetical protein
LRSPFDSLAGVLIEREDGFAYQALIEFTEDFITI